MFIQSAELTAAPGRSGDLGPMVAKMRDILSSETGKTWWSWAVLAGRPFGTHLISTRADGFVDMVATQTKLAGSGAWASMAAGADGVLAHPAETYLAEVIAAAGDPGDPKRFATVTRATISGKDLAGSIAWSVAALEHGSKVTGHSGIVSTSAAGNMFQVVWISSCDTAEELDAGRKQLNDDAEYQGMIAKAGADGLFVDGSVEEAVIVQTT